MVMNLNLQWRKIQEMLIGFGENPEEYDKQELDPSLHYDEQKEALMKKWGFTEVKPLKQWEEELETFYEEQKPEEPGLKIQCYRDILIKDYEEEEEEELEDENEPTPYKRKYQGKNVSYGVTLYFITSGLTESQKELSDLIFQYFPAIFDAVKSLGKLLTGKSPASVRRLEKAIPKLLAGNDPIVQFMRNCIAGDTNQEKCLTLSKQAGISISRQTAQTLYKYLKLETEITREPVQMPALKEAPPPTRFDMYARVQDFFEDEFYKDDWLGQFQYIRDDLNECNEYEITTAGELAQNDFIFEVGELESAKIKYFGRYHAGKLVARIYPEFDQRGLIKVLKS